MRVKPVLTGSMKTKSATSSSDWPLLTRRKGGGGMAPSSLSSTRRGPSNPKCSQTDDDPGPPLNEKASGRPRALVCSRLV